MDCNCNCFGIAASSRKPVKRYNLLVPEIFPKQSPPFQERIDVSTERKLKKLYEYVEKNPSRGPKISRRLARRVEKGLSANQPGFVQIAVAAYIYLVDRLKEDGSSLFAKEVICQQVAKPTHFYQSLVPSAECFTPRADSGLGSDLSSTNVAPLGPTGTPLQSVAGILLGFGSPQMQTLGAQLLAAFIKSQVTAEYFAHIEVLADLLLRLPSNSADQLLMRSVLTAQQEYVYFCTRTSTSCRLMQPILDQHLPLWATQQSSQVAGSKVETKSATEAAMLGKLLRSLGQQALGPAQGRGFFETILHYVDSSQGWRTDGSPSTAPAIQLLREACTEEQQQYKAYSALLHHAAESQLSALPRLSIASTAVHEGTALPTVLSSAALILAIRELLPWIGSLDGQHNVEIKAQVLELIRTLAAALDQQHLLDAIAGIMVKLGKPAGYSIAILECLIYTASASNSYNAVGANPPSTLPPVLLQEVVVLALQGDARQSIFAQEMLYSVLSSSRVLLKPSQTRTILSTIWHQVAVRRSPADFVAGSHTLSAALKASAQEELPEFSRLASRLQHSVLSEGAEHLESVAQSQKLAILLLAEHIWNCLKGAEDRITAARHEPLLMETPQLRLTDKGLEEVGRASEFGEIGSELSATLEGIRSRYTPPAGSVTVEGQSSAVSGSEDFIPLAELTQRSRGQAGSWFGTSAARSTDVDGEAAIALASAQQVTLKIRERQESRSPQDAELDMKLLLQEIGLLPGAEKAGTSAVKVSFRGSPSDSIDRGLSTARGPGSEAPGLAGKQVGQGGSEQSLHVETGDVRHGAKSSANPSAALQSQAGFNSGVGSPNGTLQDLQRD